MRINLSITTKSQTAQLAVKGSNHRSATDQEPSICQDNCRPNSLILVVRIQGEGRCSHRGFLLSIQHRIDRIPLRRLSPRARRRRSTFTIRALRKKPYGKNRLRKIRKEIISTCRRGDFAQIRINSDLFLILSKTTTGTATQASSRSRKAAQFS